MSIEFDKFGIFIILLIFFNIFFGIYTQTLIPQKKSYEYSKINVIKTYSIFLVALSFLYFWQSNAKSMTIVEFIYVIKQLLPNIKLTMTKESISYIVNYSVFLLPYSLAGIVMAQIDRVMLAKYMTTYEVGIYSVAYTLSMIPFMLFMTISKAWTPEYFKYMDEKDYDKLDRDVVYILWTVTFLLFSMILFSKEIVFILLDSRYFQANQVLPLVTFSVFFIVLWQMWGRGIAFVRKTIWSSIIGLSSAIVNVGLNYYLIPIYGIDGAVYATLFSYIFMAFFGYVVSKYYLKIYTVSIEKLKYIFGFNILVLILIFIENIYVINSLKILYFIFLVYLIVKYRDLINNSQIKRYKVKNVLREKEIYDIYLEIEKDMDLFNKNIDGIYFWKLIRFKLYFKILSSFGLVKDRQSQKTSRKEQFFRTLNIIKNSLFYSTFKDTQQKEVLFFENPRKIRQSDGKYIDPFTYYYIKEYSKYKNGFEIVDLGHYGKHFDKADEKRRFAESFYFDFIYKIKNKFTKQNFTEIEKNIIRDIEKNIFDKFEIELNIESFIEQKISDFKYQYDKFDNLFKIKKTKKVYLVCSYGKEGMIHAAQSNGIRVIEFQHGVMGKYQLGYSFPNNIKVSYFPNKLLMFGEFWSDNTDLPKKQIGIEYIGFEYLISKLNKYKDIEKEKQVLIISQPGNVDDLIPASIILAKNNPEYKFVYRLHPKEVNNWRNNYHKLLDATEKLENFEVDLCKLDLYMQILKSEFVVGINSAAIFEAITLGSKLILVNSSGIEYMNYFIKNRLAIKIESNTNLDLENLEIGSLADRNYIYKSSK